MPTTYDMTGNTRNGIQRCLRWLHRDRGSNGYGYDRKISVIIGRGIHAQAWGDELEIRDAETNYLRRPRWWERARCNSKQRLFSFQLFRPLAVQRVYCHGGEYDVELQTHPNTHISNGVLVFGNSRRDSRWYIRAIRIHDVPVSVADDAPAPSASPSESLRAFTAATNRATSGLISWRSRLQSFEDHSLVNRDDCIFDDNDDVDDYYCEEPECEAVDPSAPALVGGDLNMAGLRSGNDAIPHTSEPDRYGPPIPIDGTASVCAWIEQATANQREIFADVNGDVNAVAFFFSNLVSAAARDGGLIESSDRHVYARNTNELVGYNLVLENPLPAIHGGTFLFSIDLICGYRRNFLVDNLSQITTPAILPTYPAEPRPHPVLAPEPATVIGAIDQINSVRPGRPRTHAERNEQYRVAYGGASNSQVEMQGNWNRCDI